MWCMKSRVRVRPFNLGWCFLPSKVVSDTPFLSPVWTNLAKIQYTLDLTLVHKNICQICPQVYDTTFEGQTRQPKLKGRTLLKSTLVLYPKGMLMHARLSLKKH